MSDHIHIRKASGTWVIRADGAVLGESRNALELTEGSRAPVIYFPRADLAMAFFDVTDTTSTCPWKGTASHYALVTESGRIRDAAWSYEAPKAEVAAIAGHLAFYTDKVTVEQL
ncbi:DUF427 domain-containing protein [Fertoebacter nigrum]|uniref:DUF427 domain-containing protein n=1 Tax=Fertoeibacter niger TaxID=2656921 RepID=A0A8X8GS35_9RHOB|nr:DUF427 domain-containing protein [Fertoeibacter niger]NUB43329.1 DUF427 domain-containing protein [Fertoeibacter niger]